MLIYLYMDISIYPKAYMKSSKAHFSNGVQEEKIKKRNYK